MIVCRQHCSQKNLSRFSTSRFQTGKRYHVPKSSVGRRLISFTKVVRPLTHRKNCHAVCDGSPMVTFSVAKHATARRLVQQEGELPHCPVPINGHQSQ